MYFVVNIQRVAIPGQIFSQLQGELGVSASAIAGLVTTFMYIYALTQLLVGVLVDRYGGMRVLTMGGIAMCAGTLLFAFSNSLWMLYAGRALVGLGCGCAYLSLVKESARLYPQRFTTMLGFVIFFGYTGGIAGTLPFVRCTAAYGWRVGVLGIAALSLAVLVGIALIWRGARQPPVNHAVVLSFAPYGNGLTNIRTIRCLGSSMMTFGIYYAVLTVVGKKFLEDIGGFSSSAASLCCSAMVLFSAVCNQITGILSGMMGNMRRGFILLQTAFIPVGCLAVMLGMYLPAASGALRGFLMVVGLLLMALASGFTPITNALLLEVNQPGLAAVGASLGNFTAYTFVALFSSLAGGVLDAFRDRAQIDAAGAMIYPPAAYMSLFGIFLLIGISAHAIGRGLPETRGRNIYDGRAHPVKLRGLSTLRFHT